MPEYQSIVVLTGAGVSAESGIQTFRAQDGLWEEHRIEDVATPEAFARDPELVQNFYNLRRQPLLDGAVHPNPAHFALAQLEREFDGQFTLVTQNIDNLHEQAGSKNVLHMHGEILKMRCRHSARIFDCSTAINTSDPCACCNQAGNLRPHIVWFGEMPLFMDEIYAALSGCDLFIAIGTSGNVYPAAGFVQTANQSGAHSIEINLERSSVATDFDTAIYGKAGEVLPGWVGDLLGGGQAALNQSDP
ncbi:MAG: NAD-dependent protein deacylase [Gammaproteobacteria bacterium]|nr:NAD-dependent protein deacylase [Gammaproteobacteria bacterium]